MDILTDNINLEDQEILEYKYKFFYDEPKSLTFYNRIISRALDNRYPDLKNENGNFINIPGDPTPYSKLNYLPGNRQGVALLINYTNKRIVEAAQKGQLISNKQLDFNNTENLNKEFNRFLQILPELIYDIIDENGDKEFFDILIEHLRKLGETGKISEKQILEFIKSCKPYIRDIETGGDGNKDDIKKGIDIKFTNRGVVETVQHKTCYSVFKGKGYYHVYRVAGIQVYDVDYMSFSTRNKELFLFKNKNVEVREQENKNNGKIEQKYVFPIKDLEYKKQLKI